MAGMVETGLDRLLADDFSGLRGQKVGVISNPTGVDRRYRHLVDLIARHVVAVFGPEHGFRGSAQAGASEGTSVDLRTGITIFDAYEADQAKWLDLLRESRAETIVFDIQDAGARFYTYIWALYDSMCAAAQLGLRYVVLDRPNPCGGKAFGPVLQPGFESGVGRLPIAQQHGLTVGELARLYNGQFLATALDLEVVPCHGWTRDMLGREARTPWVAPSPNLPTPEAALAYPGTGLFEGCNVSEGRGTTRPFELIGAPFLDYHWCGYLRERGLSGVDFREAYFVPAFSKHAGLTCAGVELKVNGGNAIEAAVAMLIGARSYEAFEWNEGWIDKLTGSSRVRNLINEGANEDEVAESWRDELDSFDQLRQNYLLYR